MVFEILLPALTWKRDTWKRDNVPFNDTNA